MTSLQPPPLTPGTSRASLRTDETGSMAMYLALAVVGLAIAALLVPMVVTSSRVTRSDTSRTHAVDAAQAGLNVMVGEIRAAQTGGVGTSTLLPCGSRSGAVNGTGAAAYTVSVSYYMSNPVTVAGAQPMTCVDGYGTYDPVSDQFTPKFARITATGSDGPASNGSTRGRQLATTYVFRTTNTNIVGGRIRIYPASSTSPELCMDSLTPTPSAPAPVTLQVCASPPKETQVFAYRNDLTIQLLSSVTTTYKDGLCLDTADPPTLGRTVFLGRCQPLGSPPYTQQWSYNDNGGYSASTAVSASTGALSGQCITPPSQNAGVQLVLAACNSSVNWIPSPAVGPGAAQAPQLVNYSEFGRCLDVTNQSPSSDHLIDYPCKQNPFPGAVTWNQKFATPGIAANATSATGQITTTTGGVVYCLTSPGTEKGYATVTPCVPGSTRQTWTVYNGSSALAYSTKYTIVDTSARCLGLTVPKGSETWSAADTETCDGSTKQKWNATANLSSSVLQDTDELPLP